MKTHRPSLRGLIGSPELLFMLVLAMIGLSVLGTVIPQESVPGTSAEKVLSPEVFYYLQSLGLTHLFRSGWFISVLGLIALNLCGFLLDRFPAAWKTFRQKAPGAIQLKQLTSAKKLDSCGWVYAESPIAREEFRELVMRMARKYQVLKDDGGLNELQIVEHRGKWTILGSYLPQFAVVLILAGVLLGKTFGFQGRMTIDEGGRSEFIEWLGGASPAWPILIQDGATVPGFFKPDFQLACTRAEVSQEMQTWVDIYEKGRYATSIRISTNHPARYRGMTFHQSGIINTGQMNVSLTMTDRQTQSQHKLENLKQGGKYEYPEFSLRVLEIQSENPEMGPSAQLEYQEGAREAERFWVFSRFPGYDATHRKKSRYNFAMSSLKPRLSTTLEVVRDPGSPLFMIGGILLLISVVALFAVPETKCWYIWVPGKVAFVGWADRPILYDSRFKEAKDVFVSRLTTKNPAVKILKSQELPG